MRIVAAFLGLAALYVPRLKADQRRRKLETGDCLIRVPEAVAFSLRGVLNGPELWGSQ